MANQSLHHVTPLEHLFDQVEIGLNEDSIFVISDMIGRNGAAMIWGTGDSQQVLERIAGK